MMYPNGVAFAMSRSHCGPSVIGSMIPDSSISGTMIMFSSGASASSLLSSRPVAYDTAARLTATTATKHSAMDAARQQRHPADRGDPEAFDHASAPVGDDREPDERSAEQAKLDQQP